MQRDFQKDFYGAAQFFANQVEGAYNEGGKGLSTADVSPNGIMSPFDESMTSLNLYHTGIDFTIVIKRTLPCLQKWDLRRSAHR